MRTAMAAVLLLGAPLRVGCDCGEASAPEVLALTLSDPKTGANAVLTTQPAVLTLGGDARARAWCVGEARAEPPEDGSPCWQTERPARLALSAGDGPKTVHLWVLDRYVAAPRHASAQIAVQGSPPPITFDRAPRRISFSRQAAVPLSGGCTEVGGRVAVGSAATTCGADFRWSVPVDLSAAPDGPVAITGTQENPASGLTSLPATHTLEKDTAACRDAAQRDHVPFASGSGTSADPYLVCTADQLQALHLNPTAVAHQRDDLDLAGRVWTPIGADTATFSGAFDGRGFTIRGFENPIAAAYVGLFGRLTGTLQGVTLVDVKLSVNDYSGALVGYQDTGAQVIDCHASGTIVSPSGVHIGGLIGQSHGDVTDSDSTVALQGAGYAVGGLIGHAYGGVVRRCFASGPVTGTGGAVGGLIGRSEIDVFDSYASGAVDSGSASQAGGLVGELLAGTLTRCHAAGPVRGGFEVGGLMGVCHGAAVASYWDTGTSGQTNGPAGTGLSTAQMGTAASFAGWDFEAVWAVGVRHPVLRRP